MDLFQWDLEKEPLVIELPERNIRLIAAIYPLELADPNKKGVVFVDVWWYDCGGKHPFHEVEGEVKDRGNMWDIPDSEAEIYPLSMLPADSPLRAEWESWTMYKQRDEDGKKATKELLDRIIKEMWR